MSSKNLQKILTVLPSLPQDELLQVKAKVEAALSLSSPQERAPPGSDAWCSDWLLQGITHVLRQRGIIRGDHTMGYLASNPKIQRGLVDAQDLLLESVGRSLNTVEKVLFGQVVAMAMADRISLYASVGPRIMLQTVSQAREAVEDAFPGYLAGGMISLMVQQSDPK